MKLSEGFCRPSEIPAAHAGPWHLSGFRRSLADRPLGFFHLKDQPVTKSKNPGDFLFGQVFPLNRDDFYVQPCKAGG